MRFWFRRRATREAELDEEVRTHLDMATQARVERGANENEARRAARREFGNVDLTKGVTRDEWGRRWLEDLVEDLRYGLRVLGNNPGFACTAILTLALGIGANPAIFSVVNTVLLRPLPYKEADRLVTVSGNNRARGFDTDQVSPLDFADWRSQNHVFEAMAASTDAQYTLTGEGEPRLITAYSFCADYFHVLGTAPLLGRTFLPEEEEPGKNHVAVLSYSLWQKRFGGDRDLVGRDILLDGAPYTVVGIMPPAFQYPRRRRDHPYRPARDDLRGHTPGFAGTSVGRGLRAAHCLRKRRQLAVGTGNRPAERSGRCVRRSGPASGGWCANF